MGRGDPAFKGATSVATRFRRGFVLPSWRDPAHDAAPALPLKPITPDVGIALAVATACRSTFDHLA
jgi:hypothetical protein